MNDNNEKAILWDLDGVIADTTEAHHIAWARTLEKRGVKLTDAGFTQIFGMRNDEIIRSKLGEDITKDTIDKIADEKEALFRDVIGNNIHALPGVIDLIKALSVAGFKLAIVSSTPAENIHLVTTTLGIKDYFQCIINGRDVKAGKPDPEGYLLAAGKLGIPPRNCVVIEDAVAGVSSAKRAGMHCVAVTTTHPREKLLEADTVVESLAQLTVDNIINILDK